MTKVKSLFYLHISLFFYSLIAILSKLASKQIFASGKFLLFYSGVFIALVIYAIVWQQILKKISLSVAFANKGIVLLWGMIWGTLFFNETITLKMIIGCIIAIIGIILVVNNNE